MIVVRIAFCIIETALLLRLAYWLWKIANLKNNGRQNGRDD